MSRINYVCATCSEHFTRRNNGRRHNLRAHGGRAEIVRLIDYLAGRKSGMYEPISPAWYSNKEQLRTPLYDSRKKSNPPLFQPLKSRYRDNHEVFQCSERMIKIRELKTLLDKCQIPYGGIILRKVVYECRNGDDNYLDEKLAWLRKVEKFRSRSIKD